MSTAFFTPLVEAAEASQPSRSSIGDALWPEWSEYIPHFPTGKQIAFLMLPHREAFFGGAAGGGKSDALLMGALQYVNVPYYASVIFRKSFTDLSLPGALIERSHEWLDGTPAHWNGTQHRWEFPAGSYLQFGYLDTDLNKFRYQSSEFQYIAFDELTQHWEEDYLYLFSRLRRLKGYPVPLRVRAASNPGGVGHDWVRKRFRIEQNANGKHIGTHPKRPHIPAFISDNPFLDQESYKESLMELDPVTRAQLLAGDWGVSEDGRFKKSWFKYYSVNPGGYVILGRDRIGKAYEFRACRMHMVVDPAASVKEGPGDKKIWKRQPSWTVISTFLITPDYDVLWWRVRRFQKEVPDVIEEIKAEYQINIKDGWHPEFIGIESNSFGMGIYQQIKRSGFPTRDLHPRSLDKLVRATPVINRASQGKVYLPEEAAWLEACEAELFTWTGHPQQAADQIDTLAYEGIIIDEEVGGAGVARTRADLPMSYKA